MHDIDRTTFETGYGGYEAEQSEYGYEAEYGHEAEFGYEGEGEFGYEGEGEFGYEAEGEFYGEMYGESPFNEAEEMELAAELLSVSNEQELDRFIGKLIKKAGPALSKFSKTPIGGIIKKVAKKALPMLGSAVGNMILPGVGGMIGGKLAGAAGNMLGLELEGLSQEDQEFEVARQLVRFGGATVNNAAQAAPTLPPEQAAQTAAATAAQQYAPGLLNPYAPPTRQSRCRCRHRRSGRWIRRGNSIVLMGA